MKEMPKIQSGPPPQKSHNDSAAGIIRKMEVGQWFEIPADGSGANQARRNWMNTARVAGMSVRTYRSGDKFIIVKTEGPADVE